NTRRVGAVLSGPLIVLGGATVLGQRATFLACALLTLVGLLIIAVAGGRSSQSVATEPPSTRSFEPTTNAARSAPRQANTAANSAGSPRRSSSRCGRFSSRKEPIASSRSTPSCAERLSIIASVIGVWMNAGETALTSRPSRAYVRERPLDRASSPAFEAQ